MLGLGIIKAGAQALKTGATVFAQNREARAERQHALMAGAQERLAQEAQNRPETVTWWDSLVDGLNRLVFPSIAFTIIGWMWFAMYDAQRVARALDAINDPYLWSSFGALISLYTGKEIHARQKQYRERREGIAPVKVQRVSRAERKAIKIRAKQLATGPKQQPEVPVPVPVPQPPASTDMAIWTPRRASALLRAAMP